MKTRDSKRRVRACVKQNVSSEWDVALERYHSYAYLTGVSCTYTIMYRYLEIHCILEKYGAVWKQSTILDSFSAGLYCISGNSDVVKLWEILTLNILMNYVT